MNKNAIGLHKFSRFFYEGDDAVRFLCTPRADCNRKRLTRDCKRNSFASTRSVQIATAHQRGGSCYRTALPPHAPCRLQQAPDKVYQQHRCFASTRSVQIATLFRALRRAHIVLCLHTLRADCNARKIGGHNMSTIFASTRSVQIATQWVKCGVQPMRLCLHTLRADCNRQLGAFQETICIFASTRSVQIATNLSTTGMRATRTLPPHAPCRLQHSSEQYSPFPMPLCLHTLRADCNGRNAQNCNIHFSERVLSR